ncbi:MAG: hypothetical protein B7Y37_03195 [Sphingobacteriia bacterium 28-36-52]|nr:MAG: hypothetical protein B7Y37_03195 [Sphingobacteriia bacterium 28-36-52]
MKKVLQKILLLITVVTVVGHSILPHIHHDEVPAITQQHQHDEEQATGKYLHDDNNAKDNQHGLFSFAQLDENFVPVNSQNNSFELPLIYLSALVDIYVSHTFPVITKTHFSCYKVFPPPEKFFSSSSHRGPPTV